MTRDPNAAICGIHIQWSDLPRDATCPECEIGDPPTDPECIKLGHQPDPRGAIFDCVRCRGPMKFMVVEGEPLDPRRQ